MRDMAENPTMYLGLSSHGDSIDSSRAATLHIMKETGKEGLSVVTYDITVKMGLERFQNEAIASKSTVI